MLYVQLDLDSKASDPWSRLSTDQTKNIIRFNKWFIFI